MTNITAAETAIYSLLTSGSTITDVGTRVYAGAAPQNTAFPYIVYQRVTSEDVLCNMDMNIGSENSYLVTAINAGETFPADIAASITTRLDQTSSTVSGSQSYSVDIYRTREFSLPELSNGKSYRHQGGFFTVWVRPQ